VQVGDRNFQINYSYRSGTLGVFGVQVGDRNFQINYSYSGLTWTDGLALPPLASVSGVAASPYRGLGAFEEQDAVFFFGRENAATEVLWRMSRLAGGRGLLMVSGASGAGKSSLLRAGVLPRLRGAGLAKARDAASWPCLVFTPGHAPLDELASRVALLAGMDAAAVRRGLDDDPALFALTARQAALAQAPAAAGGQPSGSAFRGPGERRLLLVVDQFEQVFTRCEDEAERQAFITALCAAAGTGTEGVPGALVVLGLRADFEVRCAAYPELAGTVQDRYLLPAMTSRQLRMAITEPAKVARAQVDDQLAGMLLAEVRARQTGETGTGVLPLLSHALDQAWRTRVGEGLTLADYERTGGIEAAVAASAERAYGRLTAGQQEAARRVFTRLTATSPDGADTADRATRAELTEGRNTALASDVEAVLEAFAAERLLTLAADSVEISHEALLTAWPLLRDTWLAETHTDRITRTRLRITTADWQRSRDSAFLYRGTLLQAAAEAAERATADPARSLPISPAERDFLQASNRARRHAARWRQAASVVLAVLALAATAAAVVAFSNAKAAARQHAVALSRQLAAQSLAANQAGDSFTAQQLAVASWSVYPTSQAGNALTTLLAQQQQEGSILVHYGGVYCLAFSPDGRLLATADSSGWVRLWNPATGQAVGSPMAAATGKNDGVQGLAFSPDGKVLATADAGSHNGTVQMWNPALGRPAGSPVIVSTFGGVNGFAFSPDGKLLATAGYDSNGGSSTVRLWNPATGQPAGSPPPAGTFGSVNGLAFSPDGKRLAIADNSSNGSSTVRLWNPATGQAAGSPLPIGSLGFGGGVSGVAFSPDGKRLAIADNSSNGSSTVRLWNPATGQAAGSPLPIGAFGVVTGLAFSPDGKLLAAADIKGTVRLWNPATSQAAGSAPPVGIDGSVHGLAFSPDGKVLATANDNGTVRLWDPATGRPAGSTLTADAHLSGGALAFSPDGKLLATTNDNGTVRLWDPATGQRVGSPVLDDTGVPGGVNTLAFSPDNNLLATADRDGAVRLWDPTSGQPIGSPLPADIGAPGGAVVLAFSPDGKLLATAGHDGNGNATVQLWDPASGQPASSPLPAEAGASSDVGDVVFSPDSKLLSIIGYNGKGVSTVRLWDVATGQPVGPPMLFGKVDGVVLSPDGGVATVNGDTVQLRNATGQPVGSPLPAGTGTPSSVGPIAFSPDGELLATVSGGTIQLWNAAAGRPVGSPWPADPGKNSTVYGVAFSPDGKLLATADQLRQGGGTVQLWKIQLFTNPCRELRADTGLPTRQTWEAYAPGEPFPRACA
jgi:WD40 repeat protein